MVKANQTEDGGDSVSFSSRQWQPYLVCQHGGDGITLTGPLNLGVMVMCFDLTKMHSKLCWPCWNNHFTCFVVSLLFFTKPHNASCNTTWSLSVYSEHPLTNSLKKSDFPVCTFVHWFKATSPLFHRMFPRLWSSDDNAVFSVPFIPRDVRSQKGILRKTHQELCIAELHRKLGTGPPQLGLMCSGIDV